jgi:hypothetical protein
MKKDRAIRDLVDDMNDILIDQYFVVDEEESIKLLTFVWYTKNACNVPQLIEVNRFDKNTNKWKNSKFSVEKLQNFYGCEVTVYCQQFYPEFQVKRSNDSLKYSGYGVKMVHVLSKVLNFKLEFNDMDYVPDISLFIEPVVDEFDVNFELFFYRIQLYVPASEYLAVPPPVPYDGYEKLYLPFDLATWIWTLIVFAVAFLTIFIVYRMKVEVQNFIFGANVSTPSLNVVAAFCGISQVVMPTRNFARFLVMSFILYSFMIRNLYQGK